MPYFSTTSNCTCCHKCDKHQVNKLHGYIIPCENRNNCTAYQELLSAQRKASEAQRAYMQARQIAADLEFKRRTTRKRK